MALDKEKIKLLIADDSAIIRGMLEKYFSESGLFEILFSVSNGRKILDIVNQNLPDIVILDSTMPELDGFATSKILSSDFNIPTVIFAENKTEEKLAMENGASLFFVKPNLTSFKKSYFEDFLQKVYDLAIANKNAKKELGLASLEVKEKSVPFSKFKVLCIGASTGGPTACQEVLSGLKENFSLPILYVQHLDVGSDKKMADWFSQTCPNLKVKLASNGEKAQKGTVYLAPAEKHLVIDYVSEEGDAVLKLSDEPEEHFLRPAVNKLFRSAAQNYKQACLAVLLTGMGRDGAEGCKMIVENGGYTIAEDKSTCAVFGMPKAAIELSAATEVLPRNKIAEKILSLVGSNS